MIRLDRISVYELAAKMSRPDDTPTVIMMIDRRIGYIALIVQARQGKVAPKPRIALMDTSKLYKVKESPKNLYRKIMHLSGCNNRAKAVQVTYHRT